MIKAGVSHQRGNNADYQRVDAILLMVIGAIAGAPSLVKVCGLWADGVLRKVTGWLMVPVETTISRIFKELKELHIVQLEAANHRLRGRIWRQAQRAGTSKVGLGPVHWIDVDSTVDTVCGTQEGAAKGYNPTKKGALSCPLKSPSG